MDNEFLKSMSEKAQAQYDSALRWTTIVIIALLFFHFFIFSPFLNADKKLSRVEARLNSLPGIQHTVVGLSNRLTKLSDIATETLSKHLNEMFNALRSDFDDLSELVERIRTSDEIHLSETQALEQPDTGQLYLQRDIRESNIRNLIIQETSNLSMQQSPGESIQLISVVPPEQRFGFDHSLVNQVREADNIDELTRILLPTIEEKIIALRFDALNQVWHTAILPEMNSRSDQIRQRLKVAQQTDASEDAPWQSIRTALENTIRSAKDIKISPPADSFWWITVTSKGEALDSIGFHVRQELDQTITIKGITDALAKTIADQQNAEMKLKKELERIKIYFDKFVEQQGRKMVGLPEQFGGIPIDLTTLVPRFPLLIGLILAALLVWQTRRLSDLVIAVVIVKEHDQTSPLTAWMMNRIVGNRSSHMKRLYSSVGFAIAAWLWIGITFWQLTGWHTVDSTEALIMFIVSGIAMTVGFVYRWRTTERILASIE